MIEGCWSIAQPKWHAFEREGPIWASEDGLPVRWIFGCSMNNHQEINTNPFPQVYSTYGP